MDVNEAWLNWGSLAWQGGQPPGTSVRVRARTCHGPGRAGGCGGWQDQAVGPGEPLALAVGRRRYLQVELVLGTNDTLVTPQVDEVTLVYTPDADGARVTKYYYFGGQRVAMRADGVVYYLHGDHLGSTSLTTDGNGDVVARQLYHPFGTVRYAEGTLPTDFGFTGQRVVAGTGSMYYKARYYHPGLGRFVNPDSIVPQPGNPQNLNRYAYALNNVLRYTDPTGHCAEDRNADPDCWAVHDRIIGSMDEGFSVPDLWEWSLSDLQGLETWTNLGVRFTGHWPTARRIDEVVIALGRASWILGHATESALGLVGGKNLLFKWDSTIRHGGLASGGMGRIRLNWRAYSTYDEDFVETVIHEIGHIVDWRLGSGNYYWSETSSKWREASTWRRQYKGESGYWFLGNPKTAVSYKAQQDPSEDFAETFAWYVEENTARDWGSRGYSRYSQWKAGARRDALIVTLDKFRGPGR